MVMKFNTSMCLNLIGNLIYCTQEYAANHKKKKKNATKFSPKIIVHLKIIGQNLDAIP